MEYTAPDHDPYRRSWLVAIILIGVGSFLLAIADRLQVSGKEIEYALFSLVGWGLVFGSAFAVRHLGKKLLLYIPGIWILASILILSLVSPAGRLTHALSTPSECRNIGDYADRMIEEETNMNSRINIVSDRNSLSNQNFQVVIEATNSDIESMRQYSVPKAAQSLHDQRLVVMQGWVVVFETMQNETFSDQLLFDLQVEDDTVEGLVRTLNTTCEGYI